MRREGESFPPIERVIAVPYTEFEDQLVPTVFHLLQEHAADSPGAPTFQAKTLAHSRILARLTAG